MWPVWSPRLDGAPWDLSFTEAISQRMQVPSHLKVADHGRGAGEQRPPEEDWTPSFQMHVPERLLLSEMTEVASKTLHGGPWRRHSPSRTDTPLSEPPVQAAIYGELPFLGFVTRAGSQKRRHQAHHSRARKARVQVMAEETPQLRQEWLEPSLPTASQSPAQSLVPHTQFPPFPPEGRVYSFQNVLQVLRFLGHHLVRLFWKPGQGQLSSQETSTSLEEFGTTDMLAMRKQLTLISGRLQALEAQCVGWRQKEFLFYSILVPASLLHLWLWLRR
nr:fetal and adult testis-expressed transcript protein isoform X1 [Pogona vitticeps]